MRELSGVLDSGSSGGFISQFSSSLGARRQPMWLKDSGFDTFCNNKLFFKHPIWDILMRLNSRGWGGARWEGRSGVEWGTHSSLVWMQLQRESVANVIFSSRCVRPPASVHSPRTGLGGPGSDPAFALISPLILEKSHRSLWSPLLSAVR